MRASRMGVSVMVAIAVLCMSAVAAKSVVELSKATFKATYVAHGEKIPRVRLTTDADSADKVAEAGEIKVESTDMLNMQVSVTADGKATAIEQAFVRFENQRTGRDNLYLLRKRGNDLKVDVDLKREIAADLDFWNTRDVFTLQLVLGDARMKPSRTWTVTHGLRLGDADGAAFKRRSGGVFDFDIGVKKELLPEFDSPLPAGEERASFIKVAVATFAVMLPLPVLLGVWQRMGALALRVPQGKDLVTIAGLQACVLLHMACLIMFWLQWNIVTTWKAMGVVMVPTLVLVRALLQGGKSER